ncbi:MAG: FecR family protein [Bacteroidota bacterium]
MKSTDFIDQEIKEQVQLFVTGELAEDSQKEVLNWISSSSRNRRYYNGLRAALRAAEYYSSDKKYDIERVRSRLNNRIELAGKEKKRDFRLLFRVAASLLLLVSTYVVFQRIREYKSTETTSVIYNTIESPFGSRTRICLPDSTYVVLNAGSTLRYPADFLGRKGREVLLSGEGFFEVRKQKQNEFVVKVGDIGITALGTSFNVKAYPEEAVIEATLVEGLLRINRGDSKEGVIILRPNEKISLVKGEGGILREDAGQASVGKVKSLQIQKIPIREVQVKRRIDPITEISWKEKEWVIRGETMEELSVMLERRYNIDIVLGDEEVGSFSFSGTLKDETLQQVLYAIRATAPVDYQIEGSRVVLTQNKAQRRLYQKTLK